ncbi:MAG: Mut7-C RNAse domain-containing protein [Chlamydiales bacterium]
MKDKKADIRIYGELNDFLIKEKKGKMLTYHFSGKPTVKDVIESLGIPHPEVDLIIINGESVSFDKHLKNHDHVSVFPQFTSIDITPLIRLRPEIHIAHFICDVHLKKLAKYLRLCGFDTVYGNDLSDDNIVDCSTMEHRIILTRDIEMLKRRRVTYGYFVRNTQPKKQIEEVINRFNLKNQINPFSRCMECNHVLKAVDKDEVVDELEEGTKKHFQEYWGCQQCKKIYWQGSHFKNMSQLICDLKK